MSIRMLAIGLYRMIKRVEGLEEENKKLAPGGPERDRLEQELRLAQAEHGCLKSMLERGQ